MTLNYERKNAIENTREFLRSLLDPKLTPKIPTKIRKEAKALLKHYPSDYNMTRAAVACPEIFGTDWKISK